MQLIQIQELFGFLKRITNEDRIAIISNIVKPINLKDDNWPHCSFFGIYDGHGGSGCADFLRDNLHKLIIQDSSFPLNPIEAIRNGIKCAEKKFLEKIAMKENNIIDRSGSCANIVLIVENSCYIANVGDSRALLSGRKGKECVVLSRDHRPSDASEKKRIIMSGGQIYGNKLNSNSINNCSGAPLRVFPGRL